MKACGRCQAVKPLSDFNTGQSYCKPCVSEYQRAYYQANREKHLAKNRVWREKHPDYRGTSNGVRGRLRRIGLLTEANETFVNAHNDRCDICGKQPTDIYKKLHIDHCHASHKLRGMLCNLCNNGIEQFAEDPRIIRRAIEYVRRRPPPHRPGPRSNR